MIIAKRIIKDYGELRAVSEVDFEIKAGECIGLLGLNGAGKSTLLRMLACLLTPTSGTITVDGVDVTGDSEVVRRKIGYLPEEPPLYTEMTVEAFLEFVARLRKVPENLVKNRVATVVAQCQIGDKLDSRIETLSYGYKKRVGIAQAIVHQPPLVILDEPVAGLDPAQIVEMREMVKGLRGSHTVILSSHILTEISQTCDRLLIMHQGKVVASGTEEELSGRKAGATVLTVLIKGDRAAAESAVRALRPDLVSAASGLEPGTVLLTVEASSDIRAEVSRAVVQAGLGLLGLERKEDLLESIFLKLTGRGERKS